MWGAVVGILGASVALAVVSSAFETFGQTQKQEKPKGLPEPGKDFETKPGGRAVAFTTAQRHCSLP
jgi:hypothetical protein